LSETAVLGFPEYEATSPTVDSSTVCLFTNGREVLWDGTELHLASFRPANTELRLEEGVDHEALGGVQLADGQVAFGLFVTRQTEAYYPYRILSDSELRVVLETGDAPMPRSRPVTRKRLSEGETPSYEGSSAAG
jgi:hypothetical protein